MLTSSTKRANRSGCELDITEADGDGSDGFSTLDDDTMDNPLLVDSLSSFDSSSLTDCWSTVREELIQKNKFSNVGAALHTG